ncbi:AAA family ATPase, partial [Paenibacillus sepulcri]|nr:AAA family ATPase [Paenibacillus sepulcri]
AITLTELQAVGMLEGDELGKQLYHAGWGGGQAIARTEKQLNAQLDGLFRPRGSNQQMNRLIKELDDTETQLRRLEDEISSYNDLADELVQTQKQLQELESRLPAMREQAALLARAHETRPLWIGRMAFV